MRNILLTLTLGAILLCCPSLAFAQDPKVPGRALRSTFQDPAVPMIALPTRFTSRRVNSYRHISDGNSFDLANLKGPGCIRHIWICWPSLKPKDAKVVRLEINVDGVEKSQVDVPLKSFFGVMHGMDGYFIDCAAYTVLPNPAAGKLYNDRGATQPGYNLYLPVPFSKSCRITLHNPVNNHAVAMVDWHQYDKDTPLTPYRLHVDHRIYKPSPPRGGYVEMANVEGEGFICGVVVGYMQRNKKDVVFHTGGMTMLLDGETNPHAIRGHNVEDDFGFTWGFNDRQSRWIGCPWHVVRGPRDQDGVFYRFFGPDPIYFRTSLSFRTGSRGDDMESVVYTYRIPNTTAPKTQTPSEWQVMGPFTPETDWDAFQKSQYIPAEKVAATLKSDHGWIDLRTPDPYYGPARCAYARTSIESDADKQATLRLAVDDWTVAWLNGKKIAALRHDDGLKVARIPIKLKKGSNGLLVKTTNTDTPPNKRLWVINCVVE